MRMTTRRKFLFEFQSTFLGASGLLMAKTPSILRTRLPGFVAIYLDEMTEQGRKRFNRFSSAMESSCKQFDVRLLHLEFTFDNLKIATGSLRQFLRSTYENPIFFAPNGISASTTQTIVREGSRYVPIFFATHGNPIEHGFANSLERPGGAMTGFTYDYTRHFKLIELASLAAPAPKAIGLIVDDFISSKTKIISGFEKAAREKGLRLLTVNCETKGFESSTLGPLSKSNSIKGWIAIDNERFQDHQVLICQELTAHRASLVANFTPLLEVGAIATIEPIVESPYEVWARQFVVFLTGHPIGEIPIEQPTMFRRGFNLDVAQRLNIKLTRAQLASFDVLYSARNKRS
jgi:ABC-type uncharacterized transport system substrate-binding protein